LGGAVEDAGAIDDNARVRADERAAIEVVESCLRPRIPGARELEDRAAAGTITAPRPPVHGSAVDIARLIEGKITPRPPAIR